MGEDRRVPRRAAAGAAMLALAAGLVFVMGAATASAAGSVTTVVGSAYGYHAYNVTMFGGAQPEVGPTPAAVLATDASNSPQTAAAASGSVVYGPATLFSSGMIAASTSGSLGTSGSVTSDSSVNSINTSGSEPLAADNISSRCSASTSAASGSTTVTNGTVVTNNTTPTVVTVPTTPAVNTAISGKIVISSTDTEKFKFVFNEQVKSGSSIIVNAVHEYYLGPTTKGNLIIGQVACSTAGTDVSVQNPGITHTPNPVPHSGTVTFTVTVSNLGPNSAPAVADASSVTGGKISSAKPSAGTCSAPTGTAVRCKLGTIASGRSVTVQVAVVAPATSGGTIAISSTLSCPADDKLSNNTATDSVMVS